MSGIFDLSRDENATCPPKPRAAAETLLAKMVERRTNMNEGCLVDDEESVMELDGLLDC